MRKIYVVGLSDDYASWMEGTLVRTMEESDLVVFTGGEDVHPDFYGEVQHPRTYTNKKRDVFEMEQFKKAVALKKHIIGICRGSQFLCVANGGRLVQHQLNPQFIHPITMYDGTSIEITSTHHQAAYPYNLSIKDYHVLGWTNMLPFHQDGNEKEMNPEKECEIVYYPKTRCLGIQGHPEMLQNNHPSITYLRDLLTKFLSNQI